MSEMSFGEAWTRVVEEEMQSDPTTIYLATSPPGRLLASIGPDRVLRTPIAESAMTGMAIGAAASGLRPIVHWSNVTFSFGAFDQVANQAAKSPFMFGGQLRLPIVFMAGYLNGARSAAQHSQTGLAYFAHSYGFDVVCPSTPEDGLGGLRAAIRSDRPSVFLYSERLSPKPVAIDPEPLTLGDAVITETTLDPAVTLVGVGYMAETARAAADELAAAGVGADVVDLRTVAPIDLDAVRRSVVRTGRLVVVDESFPTCSIASEVIALVAQDADCYTALRAPARRICTAPVPVPFSPPLEDQVLPSVEGVVRATLDLVGYPSGSSDRHLTSRGAQQ